jgi:hypothetical protein
MEIDVKELKKIPFQTQIFYTSPKGGKFLRVVSSESETTTEKKQSYQNANIKVAQQRVAAITANLYSQGNQVQSKESNKQWSNYLADNFQEEKYSKAQKNFAMKNAKLNNAIEHKEERKKEKLMMIKEKSSKIKKS